MLTRFRILLLALVAFAAVAAPTASPASQPPRSASLELDELEIYDLNTSSVCGFDVFAFVNGTIERTIYFDKTGSVDHMIETFHGRITWYSRDTGEEYSNALVNRQRIDFPNGVDLFEPATFKVTGHHGGVFPIGGGPAGGGTLEYDGFIYAVDDEGFPYVATEGPPTSMSGNFDGTTRRICEALS